MLDDGSDKLGRPAGAYGEAAARLMKKGRGSRRW